MVKTLEQSVKDAIKSIKTGEYRGTYIKGELEGNLGRDNEYDDDYYDTEYEECGNCDGNGRLDCDCLVTESGEIDCENCDNTGSVNCSYCDGEGQVEVEREYSDSFSNGWCDQFMVDNVSAECREATVFHDFVYDGSVDSEFTFTIPIDHPEYFLEYIEAFKKLADEIGNGLDVRNAGMHISIIRTEDGDYPSGNSLEKKKLDNFRKSMFKLMPALLFLASEDYKSRPLGYRYMRLATGGHSSMVELSGGGTVLEWRVFETCYNRPEMFYDFLCVIAKGLEFYSSELKEVKIPSMGEIEFPVDANGRLGRYFRTVKHQEVLLAGMKYLLPDHRTPEKAMALRGYKPLDKRKAAKIEAKIELLSQEMLNQEKERRDKDKPTKKQYVERKLTEWSMRNRIEFAEMPARMRSSYLKEMTEIYEEEYKRYYPRLYKSRFMEQAKKQIVFGYQNVSTVKLKI